MRNLILCLAFIIGFISSPIAVAAEKLVTKTSVLSKQTSTYSGRKDDAYWTRVWYQKQAAKGRYYKNKKKVYRKKKRSRKRRASKRRSSKRNRKYSRRSGRVLAKVDLSSQRMNVYQGGRLIHTWKVSTGRKGFGTPAGTWTIKRMHKKYFSKKYDNAPMPYAMFYNGGFAVHGTGSVSRLGRRASHGCVRLHPSNAAKLFAMVKRNGGTVKVTY